jgi:hypothetical protein
VDQPSASLLTLARRPLAVAAVLVAAAVLLAWAVDDRHTQAVRDAADALAQKEQARAELAEAQDARLRLEANLRQYEALRASGFVGVPDRVALLEALESAARDLVAVPLRWEMDAGQVVETINDPKHGQPLAQVNVVPMRLQADHVHETEWLALLARLRQSPRGQLRVEGCGFELSPLRRDLIEVAAVRAECALAWVYLTPVVPEVPAR